MLCISIQERIMLEVSSHEAFLSEMSHRGPLIFLSPSQIIFWYIFVPSRLRAKPDSFHKDWSCLTHETWSKFLHLFIFGIFTQSPITISSFLSIRSYHFQGFRLPRAIQDKALSLKSHHNSSTPSSDLLTGAFSKFGVLSLPLSSAFLPA